MPEHQPGWWRANSNRMAGGLRGVSHSLLLLSGLGFSTAVGSHWRAVAGTLGLLGAAFISLAGGKSAHSGLAGKIRRAVGPEYVNRIYFAILATSAGSLAASGFAIGSPTEAAAGLWSLTWTALAAAMPDRETFHPKKLASDMLQASAAFVLVDAVCRLDALRFISGICLGGSNFSQRWMHDHDYAPEQAQEENEIEGI